MKKQEGINAKDTKQFKSVTDMLACVNEIIEGTSEGKFSGKTWQQVSELLGYTIPQIKVALKFATGKSY